MFAITNDRGDGGVNPVVALVLLIAVTVTIAAVIGVGVDVAAATSTFGVVANATDAGNASAINVSVNGTDQAHDLTSDGEFNTSLGNGTVVEFEYIDSGGNVTANASHTVGTGNETLSISDATVEVTESEASTGGGGGSGDDSTAIPDWIWKTVIGAIIVLVVFRFLDIER